MRRRWSAVHFVMAGGIFVFATAGNLAVRKIAIARVDSLDPGLADRLYGGIPLAYSISVAVIGLAAAMGAGVFHGYKTETRRGIRSAFFEEQGWTSAAIPAWVGGSTTPPLVRSAKPKASAVWKGEYRGWTAWSLEVEARFDWKGPKAHVGFHVWGLSVAEPAHRVELVRTGSMYARPYREGDMRPESALRSVGWAGHDKDASGMSGIQESWGLARVLETASGFDHVVVDGGAVWTSSTADVDARLEAQASLDLLIAVAQAMALRPSKQ